MAKPTDVSDWVEVVPQYETTDIPNDPIDASVNPPDGSANLPDYPTSQTGRIITGDFSAQFPLTTADGGSALEAKFRTHANTTKILYDDPIRNFGQPGASHGHQFFGNVNVNAYSTYQDLRTNNRSFAAGAELNATAYWFPFPVAANGRAHRAYEVSIYYVNSPAKAKTLAATPHGLRYVLGYDMDDPTMAWLQAHLDAANTAAGWARYSLYDPSGNFHGQPKWHCVGATGVQSGDTSADWLKDPSDDSDPWGGTCASGAEFWVDISGSPCWDGVNLWSPSGYRHVIRKVWDNRDSRWVCPKNFYELPQLAIKPVWEQLGPSDYMTWRLSSDDMHGSANGESFHTDWFDGWDQTTKVTWHTQCLGVEGNTPHECNNNVISGTQKLISTEAAPDGRSPQVECIGGACTKYYTNVATDGWGTSSDHNGGVGDTIDVGD